MDAYFCEILQPGDGSRNGTLHTPSGPRKMLDLRKPAGAAAANDDLLSCAIALLHRVEPKGPTSFIIERPPQTPERHPHMSVNRR